MLVPFVDALGEAQRGTAVAAFTCYDLEVAAAVLETAARDDRSVIVLVSPSSVRGDRGEAFLSAVLAYAERAPARSCVQVDHVDDLQLIERVLELGAGAVMADGLTPPAGREHRARARRRRPGLVHGRRSRGGARARGRRRGSRPGSPRRAGLPSRSRLGSSSRSPAPRASRSRSATRTVATRRPRASTGIASRRSVRKSTVPLALHGASGLPDASIQRASSSGSAK